MSEKTKTVAQQLIEQSNKNFDRTVAAIQAAHVANGVPRDQIKGKAAK